MLRCLTSIDKMYNIDQVGKPQHWKLHKCKTSTFIETSSDSSDSSDSNKHAHQYMYLSIQLHLEELKQ